jgi:tripartite-type tricarboxylate transporter receptor subunit TctC
MKRRDILLGAASSALLGVPGLSWGQAAAFPKAGTTIKYIVPFAPGGLTDIMARIVGQKLNLNLGVPVIVENKSGGNAQIGAEYVAKSVSDGTQILAVNQAHAANVSLFPNASYSMSKDLRAVALLADSPMAIIVPANSPIKTLKDLMVAAKKGNLSAASAGSGSAPHLALELFNDLNDSKVLHVPYRGGAPSLTDVIAGRVDVSFANYPQALPHIKSGRVRMIATCSLKRHPDFPQVPTARESGMPDLLMENWTGVMAHAKTPDAVVERYSRELVKIVSMPELAEGLLQRGFVVNAKGHEEFAPFLKSEIERWARVIKKANITVD